MATARASMVVPTEPGPASAAASGSAAPPGSRAEELPSYARLPIRVLAAEGSELVLEGGRRVLDLYGGHCVNTLGAGDPGILRAIEGEWRRVSFVTNLLDHEPRARFLEAFGANAPPGEWRVFASNSGAEANENALKVALASTGRARVLAFEGAFHGRTAAAAAVTDWKRPAAGASTAAAGSAGASWTSPAFPVAPFEVARVPFGDLPAARRALEGETVAAAILEPIQSMAGVRVPPVGFLAGLREACDRAGALLVFDEVQTGNGRTGHPWASTHFGVIPDAFTTAKGAAGGLPIGITAVRAEVAARVPRGLLGSTFGGGPVVLAAAAEVSRRIAAPGFLERVRETAVALRAAASRRPVVEVRGEGLLLGLVLEPRVSAEAARDGLLDRGVLVGTSDDPRVLRLSPPLTLDPAAADRLAAALDALEIPPR